MKRRWREESEVEGGSIEVEGGAQVEGGKWKVEGGRWIVAEAKQGEKGEVRRRWKMGVCMEVEGFTERGGGRKV